MEHLRRCFRTIEVFAPLGAPRAAWLAAAGEYFAAIAPMLVPTERLAMTMPGVRAGYPPTRVVEHPAGRAVAICPEELSPRRELSHEERVHHRIDEQRLRGTLCKALAIDAAGTSSPRGPGAILLGNHRPRPSVNRPVVAVITTTSASLVGLLTEMDVSTSNRRIVLTPTKDHWTDSLVRLADRRGLTIASFDEVLQWTDGAWTASDGWKDCVGDGAPPEPVAEPGVHVEVQRLKDMERDAIIALHERKFVGVRVKGAPGQEALAKLAGYKWNASFKAALSALVKMKLLGNARHHGGKGGYFLTDEGVRAAEILSKS
jgi:hypothetical protein